MAIRLVRDDEIQEVEIKGTTFQYRIIPADVRAKMEDDLLVQRGATLRVRSGTLSLKVLEWGVTGWSGVQDSQGEEVPFAKNHLRYLPGPVRSRLMDLIQGDDELSEEEEGNSERSSDGD